MNATPHAKLAPPTPAARCSAAGRLFPATRGMLRSLTLTLAFAATAAVAPAATHLFVAGHGLTDRSGPVKTVAQLKDECLATGSWMRIIEKEYDWGTLENDYLLAGGNSNNPAPQHRNWKTAGLNQIKADAELCAQNGLVLRVVLLHKYADFPAYMIGTAGGAPLDRHTVEFGAGQGTGNTERVIKLEQNDPQGVNTLGVLQGLYDKVIQTLQSSSNARRGFYGFVLQETSIGSTPYYDDGSNAANQRKSDWYANLRSFHDWLGSKLANFNSAGTTPFTPPGRLFWQMINSPYPEVATIVAQLPAGAGLCGPDTFPREPANSKFTQPTPGSRTTLYKCYDEFIRGNTQRPVSLRVASSNYYTDRAHFSETVIIGVQPIWANTNLGSSNGWNGSGNPDNSVSYQGQGNRDAGDGIANFVGCVSTGTKPDNLDLHNVIWTWSSGTLAQADVDPGQPYGPWGWDQVKNWMQTSGQFPQTSTGGCRATVPTNID